MPAAGLTFSTRSVIFCLLAVFVVPGAAFGLYLFDRYAASERARYAQEAQEVAHAVVSVLDTNIRGWTTTLQTLATSERLHGGDLEGFHRRARMIRGLIGAEIVVRDTDGRQIVNTRREFGEPLPTTPLSVDRAVVENGRPFVTNVFIGATRPSPQIAVIVPVQRDGRITHLLQLTAEASFIRDLVKPVVPDGWFIAIGDRDGVYVTRSEDHDTYAGQPGSASFIAQASGPGGSFPGRSITGEAVLVGYVRSQLSGWLVAANVRQSAIDKPLRATLWWLGSVAGLLFVAATIAALMLWRLLDRPLKALTAASAGVAAGIQPPEIATRLVEMRALDEALSEASRQIARHTAELEQRVVERTRELEASNLKLAQAQKMEAVGKLTGGIAHDFNNLLQIVSGNLELVTSRLAGQPELARRLRNAMAGVERGSKLARQLLAFGRRQPLEPRVVNVGQVVRGMDDLIRSSLGGNIAVEVVVSGGLWNTLIDPVNLENAILNLAINARDAMPDGGRLTIETSNSFLDSDYAARHDDLSPGQYVVVAVSDTGTGMAPETMARAFDPFFTTKEIGKGSGLGLSMVYGFVKQSGGHVAIYSELGHGTTVRLYLPRSVLPAEEAPPLVAAPAERGNEKVLVVEDDEAVRETAVTTLGELGYEVSEASSADAAWAMIEAGLTPDLLFTDVVMPGALKSTDLAERARRRLPGLVVLYASGYSENAIVHGGRLDAGVHLLTKPYRRDMLSRKIREVLDAAPARRRPRALDVLVAEDEALIRMTLVDMLEDLGHRVVEAGDGAAALAAGAAGRFDLLIVDIGLPDLSGLEVARRLAADQPGLKVVVASGDARPAGAEGAGYALLNKPYTEAGLRGVIEALGFGTGKG